MHHDYCATCLLAKWFSYYSCYSGDEDCYSGSKTVTVRGGSVVWVMVIRVWRRWKRGDVPAVQQQL